MIYHARTLRTYRGVGDTDAQIKRRARSCEFSPPDSFLKDVVLYHGILPGRESEAVPSYGPIFHADMDEELLWSYLTWCLRVAERRDLAPI